MCVKESAYRALGWTAASVILASVVLVVLIRIVTIIVFVTVAIAACAALALALAFLTTLTLLFARVKILDGVKRRKRFEHAAAIVVDAASEKNRG